MPRLKHAGRVGALLALLVPAARAYDADIYLGKDRAALFESYVADIRDGQIISERGFARLGTTWERELERSRRRFLSAVTKEDVYYALLSLKNSLHDAHSALDLPAALVPYRRILRMPLTLRPARGADGELRFVVVASGLPGAEPGLVLEKFQGAAPAEAMSDFREWHRSSSPEHEEFEFAGWLTARNSSRQPPPETRRTSYVFRDEKTGREVPIEAEFVEEVRPASGAAAPPEDPVPGAEDYDGLPCVLKGINYGVYQDAATKTLVLRYFSFSYSGARGGNEKGRKEDLGRLEKYLRSENSRYAGLLIDVRENDGGNVNQELLELLAAKSFKNTARTMVFTPLTRRDGEFLSDALRYVSPETAARLRREFAAGAAKSDAFAFNCSNAECSSRGDLAGRPSGAGLHYRTALLTGPYCVSSCDQFVSTFADNAMGEVVGLPSRGASAPFRGRRKFRLADGETFTITLNTSVTERPNGEVLEGNPSRPTRFLYPRRNGLREALDSLPVP